MGIRSDTGVGLKEAVRKARRLGTREGWAWLFLKMSMRLFDKVHDKYWSSIVPNRELAPDTAIFDKLQEDGIVIIPDFLSQSVVRELQSEIESVPGLLDGTYNGSVNFKRLDSDGLCALEITPALPVSYRLTVDNKELGALARALFGPECHLTAATVLNKFDADRVDSANVPHWDDWRVRFKAFIYVYDVGPQNAPTVYLKGSRRGIPWRREKDFVGEFLPRASAGGSWWPIEPLGFEKVSCTGRAGTLVLFDTLGIHAGTQLISGRRVMLMAMYTTHMSYGFRPY